MWLAGRGGGAEEEGSTLFSLPLLWPLHLNIYLWSQLKIFGIHKLILKCLNLTEPERAVEARRAGVASCFNEPDFSSWRNLVYLGNFYAAGQLLDSVFHLKTVRVLSNLLISQDLGAFLNFLRKFFTKFIKQMKDLNVALQLCQAMVIYWAYLVSGFTEPLLFDDVLGTHHHVLSLRHPVHQSGRHRHRVLQGRHLGPPVQTERKKLSMLCNGHSLCHIDIMSSTLLVIYSPCLSNGFSGSQNDHQGFSVKAFLLQQEY